MPPQPPTPPKQQQTNKNIACVCHSGSDLECRQAHLSSDTSQAPKSVPVSVCNIGIHQRNLSVCTTAVVWLGWGNNTTNLVPFSCSIPGFAKQSLLAIAGGGYRRG